MRAHRRGLKYRIWQPKFYDFNVLTPHKFDEKLNYIHNNPTKAGLCERPEDYQFSSARNYILEDHSSIKIDFDYYE